MITFQNAGNLKIIELGGGDNPQFRPNVDVRPGPKVDFTADFEQELPIQSGEWDVVFAQYVIEHLSWRKVKGFLKEVHRILKAGGRAVFVTANTAMQFKFIQDNPQGWDGKGPFESFSCVIFGDQDYPENTHKNFMSPELIHALMTDLGFSDVQVRPYGERSTDMVVEAVKSMDAPKQTVTIPKKNPQIGDMPRSEMFDKAYFNGGGKVGGYSREGYWDYPVHHITAQHILERKPESVLELGCARGYILKRLTDAGIPSLGLEISRHCYLTRVDNSVQQWDICNIPWPIKTGSIDLCYSVATLEHIPQQYHKAIVAEINRVAKRSLHGVDFGEKDDGFDQTHCSLFPQSYWKELFGNQERHEILDKEELEKGMVPVSVIQGDGKLKLNIGCFTTMYHHGWINMDVLDMGQFAQAHGYKFKQHDARNGLPFSTQSVDLIMACHFLEHLTYQEGLSFLRECRRILKPTGMIRIIVPDAGLLSAKYADGTLSDFDEINEGCSSSTTQMQRFWSLVHSGHHAAYDKYTCREVLIEAGFNAYPSEFRGNWYDPTEDGNHYAAAKQMLAESLDLLPCLSLYMNGFIA